MRPHIDSMRTLICQTYLFKTYSFYKHNLTRCNANSAPKYPENSLDERENTCIQPCMYIYSIFHAAVNQSLSLISFLTKHHLNNQIMELLC